jgi:hypothetical protein
MTAEPNRPKQTVRECTTRTRGLLDGRAANLFRIILACGPGGGLSQRNLHANPPPTDTISVPASRMR